MQIIHQVIQSDVTVKYWIYKQLKRKELSPFDEYVKISKLSEIDRVLLQYWLAIVKDEEIVDEGYYSIEEATKINQLVKDYTKLKVKDEKIGKRENKRMKLYLKGKFNFYNHPLFEKMQINQDQLILIDEKEVVLSFMRKLNKNQIEYLQVSLCD